MNKTSIFPYFVFAGYLIVFIVCAFNPYDRTVWWAENIPIMAIVATVVVLYVRGVRFSNTAYLLMVILPIMHTIGGHYTFERVPFDWFNNFFGFERNMYDRVAHFTVGFYALPLVEYLVGAKKVATRFWGCFTALCFIVTVAALYELFEWQYAVRQGGDAGIAVLGAQGDIWDAQKDMLMDTLGAVVGVVVYLFKGSK